MATNGTENKILDPLLQYCSEKEVYISSSISPRHARGRGLGIFATRKIKPGQELMHVPTSALLTRYTVPKSFANENTKEKLSVHGLLAAYLTFGISDGHMNKFKPWMATWPSLSDFTNSMPMFWPDETGTDIQSTNSSFNGNAVTTDSYISKLPPSVGGSWSILPDSSHNTSSTAKQRAKLEACIQEVYQIFPDLAPNILDKTSKEYWKYVHMWCCVNSRCFYYVKTGEDPPEDSNEAMALCPGMDLFNHTDQPGSFTRYDETGYYVTADRNYQVGEEVCLSYGPHNNDILWTEYGFIMDHNRDDGIELDALVLDGLSSEQKQTLDHAGYLGRYWLNDDGVCWRSEVIAYMSILSPTQWQLMIDGEYSPEDEGRDVLAYISTSDAVNSADYDDLPFLQAKRTIVNWIIQVKDESENNLGGLLRMNQGQVVDYFSNDDVVLTSQGVQSKDLYRVKQEQSKQRHAMCVQRWKQLWKMSMNALRSVKAECEGSNVIFQDGKQPRNLDQTVEELLDNLRNRDK